MSIPREECEGILVGRRVRVKGVVGRECGKFFFDIKVGKILIREGLRDREAGFGLQNLGFKGVRGKIFQNKDLDKILTVDEMRKADSSSLRCPE